MNQYDIDRMQKIRGFYSEHGIMPTYVQMEDLLDRTRNSVFEFSKKMIKMGRIKKVGRRIAPGDLFLIN